jgi:predicted AAA+ superfamily ATPase
MTARAMQTMPAVIVTGARQTGKSTLVRTLLGGDDRVYVTLDDPAVLDQAVAAPDLLVRRAERMTLDEVQREPRLLIAAKRAIDEDRRAGRFLITGSANLRLMRNVAETLAGRATYLTLWPMTRREQLGLGAAGPWERLLSARDKDWIDVISADPAPPEPWRDLARRGGYPTPATELDDDEDRALWFSGYITTYLERDLQELSAIDNLADFRRLLRAVALRIGNLLNQTELGRDAGLPQPTVHRYLNLMETSYQLVRLPAYSVNRTKRLIKAPKPYWCDTGLAMQLSQERDPRGAHLENLVLADLLAWRDAHVDPPGLYYWRTATGEEVDFVIERGDHLLPIEVKASATVTVADARHLRSFRAEYGAHARAALLLYDGDETYWLADGVLATPWWSVA